MKSLKNILKLKEAHKDDPLNDPRDAYRALQRELERLSSKPENLHFGSALDVADSRTHRKVADAINSIRIKVKRFDKVLDDEIKKADEKIYYALKKFM